jgi:hypothetical protein
MQKEQKKIVILIMLGIVAVCSLAYSISSPIKKKKRHNKVGQMIQKKAKNIVNFGKRKIVLGKGGRKSTYSIWQRNPFSLPPASAIKIEKLRLKGILWDENNPQAIVNDYIVGIGDKIGDNTVCAINQNCIIINNSTSSFELTM